MRDQDGWPAHRDFMNALPEGFVFLGGPVDGHRRRAMLVVRASNMDEVHRVLDPDPWLASGHLIAVLEPWEILLGNVPEDSQRRHEETPRPGSPP